MGTNVTEENKTALAENEWRLSDHYNGFELWLCYTPFYKQIIPLQQSYKIQQTLCSEDFTHQAFFSWQSSKLIIKDGDIYMKKQMMSNGKINRESVLSLEVKSVCI